jgi:hypothetical protein
LLACEAIRQIRGKLSGTKKVAGSFRIVNGMHDSIG